MKKDVEMTSVSRHAEDPKLPSAVELVSDRPLNGEELSSNPIQPFAEMRVRGKVHMSLEASMRVGDIVAYTAIETHPVKIYGEEWTNFWDYLLGYVSRDLFLHEGHIYVLSAKATIVEKVFALEDLFKVFVDREDYQLRLVFCEGKMRTALDVEPHHLNTFLKALEKYLVDHGLTLN